MSPLAEIFVSLILSHKLIAFYFVRIDQMKFKLQNWKKLNQANSNKMPAWLYAF